LRGHKTSTRVHASLTYGWHWACIMYKYWLLVWCACVGYIRRTRRPCKRRRSIELVRWHAVGSSYGTPSSFPRRWRVEQCNIGSSSRQACVFFTNLYQISYTCVFEKYHKSVYNVVWFVWNFPHFSHTGIKTRVSRRVYFRKGHRNVKLSFEIYGGIKANGVYKARF
jgi:hypothetical protein